MHRNLSCLYFCAYQFRKIEPRIPQLPLLNGLWGINLQGELSQDSGKQDYPMLRRGFTCISFSLIFLV